MKQHVIHVMSCSIERLGCGCPVAILYLSASSTEPVDTAHHSVVTTDFTVCLTVEYIDLARDEERLGTRWG